MRRNVANVVERCARLESDLQALQEEERETHAEESLLPVCDILQTLRSSLRQQRDRAAMVGRRWPVKKAQAALVQLAKVRAQMDRDPGLLIRGNTFENFRDSLGSLVRETRKGTDEHLERRREEWASISVEYLTLFTSIPALRDLCEEGLALQRELTGDGDRWSPPNEPAEIRGLLEKGQRLLAIKRQLDEFDCPDQVRDFLDRAQSPQGAPMGMLVPETRDWLERHNLLPKLKIRLG